MKLFITRMKVNITQCFKQNPIRSNMFLFGSLGLAGGIVSQKGPSTTRDEEINWQPIYGTLAYAIGFLAPVNVKIFNLYVRWFKTNVLKMVLFDQFVYMPIFSLSAAFIIKGFVEGKTKEKIILNFKENYFQTYFKMLMIWGPGQSINMCFVPLHFRPGFTAIISFAWLICVSLCV
jgi:hypothetical protein